MSPVAEFFLNAVAWVILLAIAVGISTLFHVDGTTVLTIMLLPLSVLNIFAISKDLEKIVK